jgi:DnaK suppressor protein
VTTRLATRTDLAPHLPALHAALLEQRRFRAEQLDALVADIPPAGTDDPRDLVALALTDAAAAALAEIDAALVRMGRGEYGHCRKCSAPVPLERLEILPAAALCMGCQRSRDDA